MTQTNFQPQNYAHFSTDALLNEALARAEARESLIGFTEYTFPEYETAEHHRRIADALEAVERGEIDRLMISMPPRHGKSELASKRFPAWYLGRKPKGQIIAASYNSDLATDFGRGVRNIVGDRRYSNIFATGLQPDSRAANRWNTDGGGVYVAAGVGTAVTGRGADILLIDDPIKDREEADSENQRDKVWDWYTSTAYTRLMPGGAVIVIQTRWHEDDLSGRLLDAEGRGGDQWHKVILPAISDEGQALWPERYPLKKLNRIRAAISTTGIRDWESLYQQNPTPAEGTYFQRQWFEDRHTTTPEPLHIYITSDYAVTEDGGDWTEHAVWGFNGEMLYQLDWWSGQATSDVWIEALLDLCQTWKPLCVFGEGGVIEKSVRPMLKRRMRERKVFCRMEWVPSVKDKPTRARAFQARAASGKVSLKQGEQGDDLLAQLLTFPAGKHDDKVDVCALMGMVIDEAHPAITQIKRKPKKRDPWDYDDDALQDGGDWKVS